MSGIAAISDLHLGSTGSYFNQPSICESLIKRLLKISDGELDRLYLVGDILDLTAGRGADPWVKAKDFFNQLAQYITIAEKIVYIPGNHDHHLWVMLVEFKEIMEKIEQLDYGAAAPSAKVCNTYGHNTPLHGLFPAAWKNKVEFTYPFDEYFDTKTKTLFVFHHGHFFDRSITPLAPIIGLISRRKDDIARYNAPYIETIFNSATWHPNIRDFELWCYESIRVPSIFKRRPKRDSQTVKRINKIMKLLEYSNRVEACRNIWVFGHTHQRYSIESSGAATKIINLGGWVKNHKDNNDFAWSSPAIFYWDGHDRNIEEINLNDDEKKQITGRC